ncbi:MAG: hypothetical protein IT370_20595 [Deltaproteobacteria bacterium]|nr:hypothetical protein [Deltaproteobacteria bacterium]
MTLDELEGTLPWGLHDAVLSGLAIDYVGARLTMEFDIPIDERQNTLRKGRVGWNHVAYLVIDPPGPNATAGPPGLTDTHPTSQAQTPRLPNVGGALVRYSMFCNNWNTFIHFACAEDVSFEWIGDEFADKDGTNQVSFPGEEIEVPPGPEKT